MYKEILRFHVEQAITQLFKRFIFQLEDLKQEHRAAFEKLRQWLPEEYHPHLDLADYFDDNKYAYFRKRVLDIGNETKRNIHQEFDKFDSIRTPDSD